MAQATTSPKSEYSASHSGQGGVRANLAKTTRKCHSYLCERAARFPRAHRHTLGADITGRCLALLAVLVRAKFLPNGPEKRDRLAFANTELEVLRFVLRLAHDLKALPHDSHRHALERLQNVGRQLGGWRKALADKGAN